MNLINNYTLKEKFGLLSISSDFPIEQLPSYETLINFTKLCNKEFKYEVIWGSPISYRVCYNLLIKRKKLSIYQCVAFAFNDNKRFSHDRNIEFLKLYTQYELKNVCFKIYEEASIFLQELTTVKKQPFKELLMKYIDHVGHCEGATFLNHKSDILSPIERYYINKLHMKHRKD